MARSRSGVSLLFARLGPAACRPHLPAEASTEEEGVDDELDHLVRVEEPGERRRGNHAKVQRPKRQP